MAARVSGETEEIAIFAYARMLWRRKWLVLTLCLLGCAVAIGANAWLPKVYESTATLISPGGNVLLGTLPRGERGRRKGTVTWIWD